LSKSNVSVAIFPGLLYEIISSLISNEVFIATTGKGQSISLLYTNLTNKYIQTEITKTRNIYPSI